MTTLYLLGEQFRQAIADSIDEDGEILDLEPMRQLSMDFEKKALAVKKYCLELESQAEAMKSASERILKRRGSLLSKIELLNNYLISEMEKSGILRASDEEISISLRDCPPSVNIYAEDEIPIEFWREKIVRTPDKLAIKAAGGCPGASIETGKHSLLVK